MSDISENNRRTAARDALLTAAATLFTEKGYEAVSTRELADLAGVNLAAIQYHFGSKEKLFLETIKNLMGNGGCQQASDALRGECATQVEAARKIFCYVKASLDDLVNRSGPQPCKIMFREILNHAPSSAEIHKALVHFVVEDYVRPLDELILAVLKILAPEKNRKQLEWCAQSFAGQLSFYITHRPFYEQLRGKTLSDQQTLRDAAVHVAEFSLRGLGVDEKIIREARGALHLVSKKGSREENKRAANR